MWQADEWKSLLRKRLDAARRELDEHTAYREARDGRCGSAEVLLETIVEKMSWGTKSGFEAIEASLRSEAEKQLLEADVPPDEARAIVNEAAAAFEPTVIPVPTEVDVLDRRLPVGVGALTTVAVGGWGFAVDQPTLGVVAGLLSGGAVYGALKFIRHKQNRRVGYEMADRMPAQLEQQAEQHLEHAVAKYSQVIGQRLKEARNE